MKNPLLFLQDFAAPFLKFLKSEYRMKYEDIDNLVLTTRISLSSFSINYFAGYELQRTEFCIDIDEKGINTFKVIKKGIPIFMATCTDQY